MITRIASLPYQILELARKLDRRFAAASVEQARDAVLANQRRREPLPRELDHWLEGLATGPPFEVKAG